MDIVLFLFGLLVGLLVGAFAVGRRIYRQARNAGCTRPQAVMRLIEGGGGPPRDP